MRLGLFICTLGAYSAFGQLSYEFKDVVKLPENINSEAEEIMPIFSTEGEMYFVRARHEDNEGGANTGHDIWKSKQGDSYLDFSDPNNNFKKLNNKANNAVVGVSKDNDKLYVLNSYHKETSNHHGIATVNNDGKWNKPEYMEIQDMDYNSELYGFFITPNDSVMVISMQGDNSQGLEDLYISEKRNGIWSKPAPLGSQINTRGFEISPSISPDGKRLYFSSNGHGGSGDADMFYCTRTGASWLDWSAPINMGPQVNSPKFDAYFVEGPNAYGYFASNREDFHSDLYCVKINTIEPPEIVEVEDSVVVIEEPDVLPPPPPKTSIPQFKDINFENDSDEIADSEKEELDKAADFLKKNNGYKVLVTGHTDATWTDAYNLQLSKKRALAAQRYLLSLGVNKDQISIDFEGEKKLKVKTEETSRVNRRVVLIIQEK